jgi:hypothetical protein
LYSNGWNSAIKDSNLRISDALLLTEADNARMAHRWGDRRTHDMTLQYSTDMCRSGSDDGVLQTVISRI